jgi:alanine dehydrogenase
MKVGVPKETKSAERRVAATPAGVKALTDQELTEKLLDKKVVGIAYETVQLEDGTLPLLAPMSEVAGALSIQMGAYCLEAKNGGMCINTCLNTSVANGS